LFTEERVLRSLEIRVQTVGQVVKVIKSITVQEVFRRVPSVKQWLWGGEFWTDGYYIATVSGRGDRKVIEEYIKTQGRQEDVKQLRLFE